MPATGGVYARERKLSPDDNVFDQRRRLVDLLGIECAKNRQTLWQSQSMRFAEMGSEEAEERDEGDDLWEVEG